MTIVAQRTIIAENTSEAWLDAVVALNKTRTRKVVHLVMRIKDPRPEQPAIRGEAQLMIDETNRHVTEEHRWRDIDTTRNTIFPATWAARALGPIELADYYRARYAELRRYRGNRDGTYFGRIVAYPRIDGSWADQLNATIEKLNGELATQGPKSSRFEISIYSEAPDGRRLMGFPCLAHLSLHLDQRRLHLQAVYRNEHLIARAYGNYRGLADLQVYIADSVGIEAGELAVIIGHAYLEADKLSVGHMLERLQGPEH